MEIEDLLERINVNSKLIGKLAEGNIDFVQTFKKQNQYIIDHLVLNQSFFNDYVSVASELTSVPRDVIINRVKEAAADSNQKTNLFVVK